MSPIYDVPELFKQIFPWPFSLENVASSQRTDGCHHYSRLLKDIMVTKQSFSNAMISLEHLKSRMTRKHGPNTIHVHLPKWIQRLFKKVGKLLSRVFFLKTILLKINFSNDILITFPPLFPPITPTFHPSSSMPPLSPLSLSLKQTSK